MVVGHTQYIERRVVNGGGGTEDESCVVMFTETSFNSVQYGREVNFT